MDRGAWQATVHRVAKSSHNWVTHTCTQKPLTSSQNKFGTTVSIQGNRQTYFSIDTKIFVWIAFLSENHRLYSCSSFLLLGTRRWVKEPLPAEAPSQGSSLQTTPSCPKAEEGWGLVSRAFLEIITTHQRVLTYLLGSSVLDIGVSQAVRCMQSPYRSCWNTDSDSVSLRICIPSKFPNDMEAASLGTTKPHVPSTRNQRLINGCF